MDKMRLQKYLALAGVASRRKSEELISAGLVTVNSEIVVELGFKVDPNIDIVHYKGELVKVEDEKVYYKLYKPVGYITTSKDQFDRPNVVDIIKDTSYRIYPVGRLDYNTSGLLILTNDGDLTNKITHPKHHVEKTYLVSVNRRVSKVDIDKLEGGIDIGGYVTRKCKAHVVSEERSGAIVEITISEGKNRQVRKMFEQIGNPVVTLKRIKIGSITLDSLKDGEYIKLSSSEIKYLKDL